MSEHSVQGLTTGENSEAELYLLGFYQSLTDLGGGKYPTPDIWSHQRGTTAEKLFWSSQSRSPGTEKLRSDHRTIEHAPPLHLSNTWPKAYLQQFLLPSSSCPALKDKLQVILNGKPKIQRVIENISIRHSRDSGGFHTGNLKQLRLVWSGL